MFDLFGHGKTAHVSSVTITQVAERAGVSMKTVSRVLNAEPHVREEVKARVLKAAAELRYRPKVSARSLAGARSFMVGYLLSDPSLPYNTRVQLGALTACRRAGYHLVVEYVDLGAPDLEAEIEPLFTTLAVDGVLLTPPHADNRVVLDCLDQAGIAYARLAPQVDPGRSPRVDADDRLAAAEMTRHLIGLGHRRIGFIGGHPEHGASRHRLDGHRQALREAGLDVDEDLIAPGDFSPASGRAAAERLMAGPRQPTAVFAANDVMAIAAMATIQQRGLSVPHDISVAGFDDLPTATLIWPSLTTMRQPIVEMAAAATEMLIAIAARGAHGGVPAHRTMHCELVVRASTAPPKA